MLRLRALVMRVAGQLQPRAPHPLLNDIRTVAHRPDRESGPQALHLFPRHRRSRKVCQKVEKRRITTLQFNDQRVGRRGAYAVYVIGFAVNERLRAADALQKSRPTRASGRVETPLQPINIVGGGDFAPVGKLHSGSEPQGENALVRRDLPGPRCAGHQIGPVCDVEQRQIQERPQQPVGHS